MTAKYGDGNGQDKMTAKYDDRARKKDDTTVTDCLLQLLASP